MTKIRSSDGRILGKLGDYSTYEENEFWKDQKVKSKDIIFPRHKDNQNSDVKVYHISELGLHD